MSAHAGLSQNNMSEFRPRVLGTRSRLFLLLLSEINLILGALFYVQPDTAASLWPWPVKTLAVRFLGAIFLAITLGCWSALRVKVWQRGKILTLVGATFFGITFLVTAGVGLSPGGSSLVWAWAVYFLAAAAGLLAILKHYGWRRKPQDRISQEPVWMVAKTFFRIQTVLVGVFGTFMLFTPDFARPLPSDPSSGFWPWQVPVATLQTFAALFLATCLATGWASLQSEKARIRALLPLDAVFPTLALLAVGVHWDVIVRESPSWPVTGVWLFVYSFVAAGSTYLFFAVRKAGK